MFQVLINILIEWWSNSRRRGSDKTVFHTAFSQFKYTLSLTDAKLSSIKVYLLPLNSNLQCEEILHNDFWTYPVMHRRLQTWWLNYHHCSQIILKDRLNNCLSYCVCSWYTHWRLNTANPETQSCMCTRKDVVFATVYSHMNTFQS